MRQVTEKVRLSEFDFERERVITEKITENLERESEFEEH